MRPNLSIERLAVTLAALGTTAVVAACTRAEPAATTRPDTPTSSASAPPPPEEMKDETKKSEAEKEPAPKAIGTASGSARPLSQPTRRAPNGDKGGTGQASCGAGTCTADPKKK